jgi:PPP family 3-phenylpropionic acid transporter
VAAMIGLLLITALRLPATHEAAVHDEPAPPVLPLLRRPEVAWFFAGTFFTVLAHTSLYAFFSLYLVQLGYGKTAVGGLWAVSVVVEIVFFWTQGRWFGRLSPQRWLEIVAGVTMLRFAATAAFGAVAPVLVLAQATHAITFAAHHSACIQLVTRLFPGRLRVLGGVAGGWIIDAWGYAAVFWTSTGCAALGWLSARQATRALAARPFA